MRWRWMLLLSLAACDGPSRTGGGGGGGGGGTRADAGPRTDGGARADAGAPIDAGPTDPRCDQGCTISAPAEPGVGQVCSSVSAASCKLQCDARVQRLSAACAACLSDGVDLRAGPKDNSGQTCNPSEACPAGACRESNAFDECTYCSSDDAARLACHQRLDPRREVWCSTALEPSVLACNQVCTAADRAVARAPGSDPRCAAICRIRVPELEGAYDVCSAASAVDCVTRCNARIAGAASLCASCLLEGARFGGGLSAGNSVMCNSDEACASGTRCVEDGCAWCENDRAQREACIRQVHPRREIACTTTFDEAARCAPVCGGT